MQLARTALAPCAPLKVLSELPTSISEEEENLGGESYSARRKGSQLDLRHETWGNGVDMEGIGSSRYCRVFLAKKRCSAICLWEARGQERKHYDGTFRFVAEGRPAPTVAEQDEVAALEGLVIRRVEPRSEQSVAIKPGQHVDRGWVLRGPAGGGPHAPIAGIPHEAQQLHSLEHGGKTFTLEPSAPGKALKVARRHGRFELYTTTPIGRSGGQTVHVRDPAAGTYRSAFSSDGRCGGKVSWIGASGDLLLLAHGYEHPALHYRAGDCLAVLDVPRALAFTLELPKNSCLSGDADGAHSFAARVKGQELVLRCIKPRLLRIPLRALQAAVTKLGAGGT